MITHIELNEEELKSLILKYLKLKKASILFSGIVYPNEKTLTNLKVSVSADADS